ncbi:MAG: hypothetical protein Q8L21_01780 [Candidatus Komeilibacteria bacterium]|nr:hypothetical protein [Candidatus Komeilibacteria bacterium]
MVDEKLVTHFVCQGGCNAVAPTEGACTLPTCSKFNQPLTPCGCTDGLHGAAPKVEVEVVPVVEQPVAAAPVAPATPAATTTPETTQAVL